MKVQNSFAVAAFAACLLFSAPLQGCANRSEKTVRTTEDVTSPDPYARGQLDTERHTETKETKVETSDSSSHGLFSILGDIIALPFRAVGALLSAIF